MSSFLWMGIVFAIISIFGNKSWLKGHKTLKDIKIFKDVKFFENSFLNSLKILVGTLFGPLACPACPLVLLEKNWLIVFMAKTRKMSLFSRKCFCLFFSVILVKKLQKWLEICLELASYLLPIRKLERDSLDLFFMFMISFMVFHSFLRFFCCFAFFCFCFYWCIVF